MNHFEYRITSTSMWAYYFSTFLWYMEKISIANSDIVPNKFSSYYECFIRIIIDMLFFHDIFSCVGVNNKWRRQAQKIRWFAWESILCEQQFPFMMAKKFSYASFILLTYRTKHFNGCSFKLCFSNYKENNWDCKRNIYQQYVLLDMVLNDIG